MRTGPILVLGTLFWLGPAVAAQQPGSIRGVVQDGDFEAPLFDAEVLVVETGQRARTGDLGGYVIDQVPPGAYTVVFSKEGYVRQVRSNVVVSPGALTEVDAALSGDFTDLEEFVVKDTLRLGGVGELDLLQMRFQSPSLLDSISADMMSRAGASDAAGALRLVTGATIKDGKTAVIRGLPDRYVVSMLNGVRMPSADEDTRAVQLDQFPSAVIDSIQVAKTFTPDQHGDASGGAVDVRLKGIPDEPFLFRVSGQAKHNTQASGRGDFLSYDGGGVSFLGRDDGRREIQHERLGESWAGAIGVNETEAPVDYKIDLAMGASHTFDSGLRIGGLASVFYDRDSDFYRNGKNDSLWVEEPGGKLTPKAFQGSVQDGDFRTNLFDVTQGSQEVKWGGLVTLGISTEDHALTFAGLYTRTTEDKATLAEDTRGKHHFFPDYDPEDRTTEGHSEPDAAPYLRTETLEYTERTTSMSMLSGRHVLPFGFGVLGDPRLSWTVSESTADLYQPDKRQFGEEWFPGRTVRRIDLPPSHRPFKPAANFTLGNLQRIWKSIDEESRQYEADLELPFDSWTGGEGHLKLGVFDDTVRRTFDQETFSNFGDNSSYSGPWKQRWSSVFPLQHHPVSESLFDVDYLGEQDIFAWYAMARVPVTGWLEVIGGARFESTDIMVVNDPEENATWFPPGSDAPVSLKPGDADAEITRNDTLPSIALVVSPADWVTMRASYSETLARMTFKEITPILQQEFLGGPIFIGNPELRLSDVENFDLRLDLTPSEGSLLSASWFRKDIVDPIEYVQVVSAAFDFTFPINFPEGRLQGWELEARQDLGAIWGVLTGLTIGGNATFIDSEATLPEEQRSIFRELEVPMETRAMTNAPEHLYNLHATYDLAATGSSLSLFYTVTGDTLVAGATESKGNFVPDVYATEYDTLNLSFRQALGDSVFLRFQAKNLTDPVIETVYRSEFTEGDARKTSFTRGTDFSLTIGGRIEF